MHVYHKSKRDANLAQAPLIYSRLEYFCIFIHVSLKRKASGCWVFLWQVISSDHLLSGTDLLGRLWGSWSRALHDVMLIEKWHFGLGLFRRIFLSYHWTFLGVLSPCWRENCWNQNFLVRNNCYVHLFVPTALIFPRTRNVFCAMK